MDCAAPCHDREPVEALPAAFLCRTCRSRLSRHLRRLPGLYDELDLTPSRRSRGRGSGDGLPYSDPVSECRSQIRHDLVWWTCHVADLRRTGYPPFTIGGMCGWLHGQLSPFIECREWAGDLAGAIAADHGKALAILDPFPASVVERKSLLCGCGGQLVFVMYGDDDKRTSVAMCKGCGGEWPIGPAWMTLRKQMRQVALAA